jgi:hypothetical protein
MESEKKGSTYLLDSKIAFYNSTSPTETTSEQVTLTNQDLVIPRPYLPAVPLQRFRDIIIRRIGMTNTSLD